jgi:hypothetical protein
VNSSLNELIMAVCGRHGKINCPAYGWRWCSPMHVAALSGDVSGLASIEHVFYTTYMASPGCPASCRS